MRNDLCCVQGAEQSPVPPEPVWGEVAPAMQTAPSGLTVSVASAFPVSHGVGLVLGWGGPASTRLRTAGRGRSPGPPWEDGWQRRDRRTLQAGSTHPLAARDAPLAPSARGWGQRDLTWEGRGAVPPGGFGRLLGTELCLPNVRSWKLDPQCHGARKYI